jgi:hypothetical protein
MVRNRANTKKPWIMTEIGELIEEENTKMLGTMMRKGSTSNLRIKSTQNANRARER